MRGGDEMKLAQAQQLARILSGELWESHGRAGVLIRRDDDRVVLITDDAVVEFQDEAALQRNDFTACIFLSPRREGPASSGSAAARLDPPRNDRGDRGFRNSTWGDSKASVKGAESAEFVEESEDVLVFKDRVVGLRCLIGYYFVAANLVRAQYVIIEEHTNETETASPRFVKRIGGKGA